MSYFGENGIIVGMILTGLTKKEKRKSLIRKGREVSIFGQKAVGAKGDTRPIDPGKMAIEDLTRLS